MLREKEYGFVLKRFLPNKQKLSVLSASMGKITVVIPDKRVCQRLWPGMLLSFFAQPTIYSTYITHHVDILYVPQEINTGDLYWMYHLLELSYYFFAQKDPDYKAFESISSYFALLDDKEFFGDTLYLIKQLCVLHFLQETGLFSQSMSPGISPDMSERMNIIEPKILDKKYVKKHLCDIKKYDIKKINTYIFSCLKQHPSFKLFKTVRFMY